MNKKKELEEKMKDIQEAINNRVKTHHGIYHDIGIILEKYTTQELVGFYMQNNEHSLRNYVEEQIIAEEINKASKKKKI